MSSESDCGCRCHLGGAFVSCDVDAGTSGVPNVAYCGPHTTAEAASGYTTASDPARPSTGKDSDAPTPQERAEPLLTARDHWDAADRLTRPTWKRLVRDNGHTERVQLPSLLDQLVEAMDGGETGGAHGVPASKPPMDAASLSLLCTITNTVRDGLRQRRIKRTFRIEDDLRALVSAVNTENDPARIDACARLLRSWAAQIKATISNDVDRTWRMHGAACRVCGSKTVPVFDEDGTETRQPALIVHSNDGVIDLIRCDFCGTELAGPDLVDIVRRAPRVGTTSETA
jgi:hypothetical protein